ncbi:phosphatase PAP2 family protein [Roseburia sp. 831b]|uniref:phosphatase PAP2 family protein n=1 Tax=Roseburia sp. 831b TaxID=1261635 RepID=UPI000952A635|nr:phosphatase PAP2 family protein [Roseburia sp. 831b]WVK71899.1 phosphatase PAP2 family protein [Roseburia sp. 831b]
MKTLTRKKVNEFIAKYKHGLLLLYFLIYLPWFGYLEENVTTHFHVIHVALDDKIPFCEYFIIPYMLWFAYVAWGVAYFFFKNKSEYYKLCAFLFTGMTIFLVISTVYPNGHYLRPTTFERDNIFVQAVQWLYSTDTPTNLFPSIHVYNSLGINMAVWHSENFKKNKPVRYGSAILCISIILSTMFLKQHSVFDVVTGIVLAAFMFSLVYARSWANEPEHELERNLHQY